MDADRFDTLTRSLTRGSSRRGMLQLVTGGALGGLLAALAGPPAEASHFGCRHFREPCTRGRQCCSSRCSGPRGSKTCAAHHTGGCAEAHDICRDEVPNTTRCPNINNGECYTTIGDTPFCAALEGGVCKRCTSDRDCVRRFGFPPGSACVFMHGRCELACGATNDGIDNDRMCIRPAV